MGGMSFSEPPFRSLPVTQHLNSATHKSLAWPFLTRWIIPTLFLGLKQLALCPAFAGWALGEADATASLRNEAPASGFKDRYQGSIEQLLSLPPLPYACKVAPHAQGEAAWEGCVSLGNIRAAKGPRVRYACAAVSPSLLLGYWVCTKISNMKESRTSQELLVHGGR